MTDRTSTIIWVGRSRVFEDKPISDHQTRTYAMVSTYPPTQCGIATFAAALSGGLYEYGDDVGIVRVGADGEAPAKIVVAELNRLVVADVRHGCNPCSFERAPRC